MRDAVWGYECASRIIGVAEKDQARLALLEELRNRRWHHAKPLGVPGCVLAQASPHKDGSTCVLAEGRAYQ
jgi:hypothetical protein